MTCNWVVVTEKVPGFSVATENASSFSVVSEVADTWSHVPEEINGMAGDAIAGCAVAGVGY